jgi:hypothetical protein
MSRLTISLAIGFAALGIANAGTIQIGGPSGLTANYINQVAGAVCAAGTGNCVHGSTTGWMENNYNNVLFAQAQNGSTTPAPFPGYSQTSGEASGSVATDVNNPNVQFAMIADGAAGNGASNNYWGSTATGVVQDSITIPVGAYGVTDVWTMLQNQFGTLGGNDTSVFFNFGSSSNQASGYNTIEVDLVNSNNQNNVAEMRASLACTTVGTYCNSNTNPHGFMSSGVNINGVIVNTSTTYNTFTYNSANSNGFYAGTGGKLKLDDQQFVFTDPSLLSQWLVSITITENVANTFASYKSNTSGPLPSETVISAITVDTVPEPSTVFLLLSGVGSLAFFARRRK